MAVNAIMLFMLQLLNSVSLEPVFILLENGRTTLSDIKAVR